jgi:uncharacterized membrane protein (UPF0136 family)
MCVAAAAAAAAAAALLLGWLVCPAGGVMAYVKAGSTKSLTTAGGCALILALSGRKMVGAAARVNLGVAAAIAALLSVVMCSRYARTRKLMPAGITAAASVCMTAAYINGLFQ